MEVVDKLYRHLSYCIRNSENRKIDLINSEPKSELYECSFLFSYNVNQQKIIVLTQGQTLCYTVNYPVHITTKMWAKGRVTSCHRFFWDQQNRWFADLSLRACNVTKSAKNEYLEMKRRRLTDEKTNSLALGCKQLMNESRL